MAKYVQIQSELTITVTSGLQCKNFTKLDSDLPDRLRVKPTWPKMTVLIKKGKFYYPAEVAEWETVKSLVRNKLMTIDKDSVTEDESKVDEEAKKFAKKLSVAMADPGKEPVDDMPTEDAMPRKARAKKQAEEKPAEESLEEIVEEDK